jgi:hypothetical protein
VLLSRAEFCDSLQALYPDLPLDPDVKEMIEAYRRAMDEQDERGRLRQLERQKRSSGP